MIINIRYVIYSTNNGEIYQIVDLPPEDNVANSVIWADAAVFIDTNREATIGEGRIINGKYVRNT